jgi:hypothetical protein
MLKLNEASESRDILAKSFQEAKTWMDSIPPADSSDREREDHYFYTGTSLYVAGAEAYRFEFEAEKVRELMRKAAGQFLLMHGIRPMPIETDQRNPWLFLKTVGLIVCFCKPTYRKGLANVERWKYSFPENPALAQAVDYLQLLTEFVSSNQVNLDQLNQIKSRCQLGEVDQAFVLPQLEGLDRIARRNEQNWLTALTSLLRYHEQQCWSGDYKLSPDGYLCLPAMMLAQLGRENRLQCNLSSLYLPLQLLGSES